MANIAVLHANLMSKGGAEAVCLNVLESLQESHDLTLFTNGVPSFSELNSFFDTAVDSDSLSLETNEVSGAAVELIRRGVSPLSSVGFGRLQMALLARLVRKKREQYDLVISTKNEVSASPPSIQYIHSPKWNRSAVPGIMGNDSTVQPVYDAFCKRVGGSDQSLVQRGKLLANSRWTAAIVEEVHETTPEVVYPPVPTEGFPTYDWEDQEHGFVTMGRIARTKKIEAAIEISDALRNRGHDIHLHLVGPIAHSSYEARLREITAERPYVELEGELSRAELLELLASHRYGLHTRTYEHFGIAVAELVVAGSLPFVPASGGQTEVVDGTDQLCYRSNEDAIEKIDSVLSSPNLQRELLAALPDVEERFGRERFQQTIRRVVDEGLNT